jgi:hypothetical protein
VTAAAPRQHPGAHGRRETARGSKDAQRTASWSRHGGDGARCDNGGDAAWDESVALDARAARHEIEYTAGKTDGQAREWKILLEER